MQSRLENKSLLETTGSLSKRYWTTLYIYHLNRVEVRRSLSARTASRVSDGILEKASSVGAKMVNGPSP